MKKGKQVYFENLDGLRFLCFLSVFFFHSFHTEFTELQNSSIYSFVKKVLWGNGNIGVNFFFVLSGFLITYLLIQEKINSDKINLKFFWVRRILRIWPLYYSCVFFGFVVFPFLKQYFGQIPNETANPFYYLVFLNNFDFIEKGLPDASILGVLWSVAIEEQFYLVWPIIVFVFPVKKLWIPFLSVVTLSLLFRALNDSPLMHEYHTLSCIGDMATGGLGAWLIICSIKFKLFIHQLSKKKIFILYVLFTIVFFYRGDLFYTHYVMRIFERLILATIILAIILEQTYSTHSLFKMSRFKKISKLGLITYGLYCLHFVGILIVSTVMKKMSINDQLWQIYFIETPLSLLIAIFISLLSYKYIEKPFLKFKEKFSS